MSHSEYRLISKKGEGTFSEVLKAQSLQTGEYVAIKCMKNHFGSIEQVNNLREIQALKRLSPHDNIIRLIEVLFDQPTGECVCVCVRERERERAKEKRITYARFHHAQNTTHLPRPPGSGLRADGQERLRNDPRPAAVPVRGSRQDVDVPARQGR